MKFHIFECNLKITFDQLITFLIKENIDKFLNVKFDQNTLSATFYKEMKRAEKTIDKDGKEIIVSFDYYLYQDFSFHTINNRFFLVINEPNKYTKYFKTRHRNCNINDSFLLKRLDIFYNYFNEFDKFFNIKNIKTYFLKL